jgi:hypothetical protein
MLSTTSLSTPSISRPTTRADPPHTRPAHTRASKFSTLNRDQDAQREQRRKAFLGRVKDAREERRHDQRGEANVRRRWIEERQAWWIEREREGEMWCAEADADMDGEQQQQQQQQQQQGDGMAHASLDWVTAADADSRAEMDEVEMLAREEEMYAAMADAAEAPEQDRDMTEFGSDDDDDYERLMLDIAMQAESEAQGEVLSSGRVGDQAMDTS